MALLQWKDRYSLGIEAIDHEHKGLIDLINRLHGELMKDVSGEATEAFFGDLLMHISAHFALEERIMLDRKYDQFPDHKKDHERLLDDLRDIMDNALAGDGPEVDADALAKCLDDWFSRHFETHDARFHGTLHPKTGH
jgi:hemerythrin-like metal-binding protein